MTAADSLERRRERETHAEFAQTHAREEYRTHQGRLLGLFEQWNRAYFGGELIEPHLDFGGTPPRALMSCSESDGSGGDLLITIKASVVFGTHDGVLRPGTHGHERLVEDLFLRGLLHQDVIEVRKPEAGFDAVLTAEANRIGLALGLPRVAARNRPGRGREPLAKFWPCCVRPRGYYQGAISRELEDAARGAAATRRPLTAPSLGILEFLRYLLERGRAQAAQAVLARHAEWLRMFEPSRRRRIPEPPAGLEEMKADTDGSPLGEVNFDQGWLEWNDGTVDLIARSIRRHRTYAELPVLADALEEAGCREGKLLRHLRERVAHNADCWALNFVLALDAGGAFGQYQAEG